MSDMSDILIDFCSLFDGVIRLRFFGPDSFSTFDYCSSLWSHTELPAVDCKRIDTFLASYSSLHACPVSDNVFYVDLPTVFGYLSRRGKWLATGSHHARVFFDYHALFGRT